MGQEQTPRVAWGAGRIMMELISIEFPAAKREFHLIVGPNEAAKSSLRTAIQDLLFGIPLVRRWALCVTLATCVWLRRSAIKQARLRFIGQRDRSKRSEGLRCCIGRYRIGALFGHF
ncbi:MAG: AAA family ATPase [Thiobacillaceae bacterium]